MSVNFNYIDFINYYKDPVNLNIDPNPPITNYYHGSKTPKQSTLSGEYIEINGTKIYITIKPDNSYDRILFSIPTDVKGNGVLWDFHYHFGIKTIDKKSKNNKGKTVITTHTIVFLHKTIQDPDLQKKNVKNCYFIYNAIINDISILDCMETKSNTMTTNFPKDTDDFMFIEEIIRRPFFGVQKGGKWRQKQTKHKKKLCKRKTFRRRAAQN